MKRCAMCNMDSVVVQKDSGAEESYVLGIEFKSGALLKRGMGRASRSSETCDRGS